MLTKNNFSLTHLFLDAIKHCKTQKITFTQSFTSKEIECKRNTKRGI